MSKSGSKQIKVTLERSIYGQLDNIVKSVRGLGLRRRHQTVTVADTPENRGMVRAARHLVSVVEA
ncbi:MAG: 50S ribosomal protein L30 [Steroidobacteraceae bacterium]|jgi:large subunit ribosomal protein L30